MANQVSTKAVVGGMVALAATVAITAMTTLALTSGTSNTTDIVTMKGGTVTVSEFYEDIKSNPAAQQTLVTKVISEIFKNKYASKISDKDVQKKLDEQKELLGEQFESYLANSGMTTESYKETIRENLVFTYAIDKAAAKGITDEMYQAAYDNYTPEVTAQIIKLNDKAKAQEVLEKAKAEGADFGQLAKENSVDNATKDKGGEVKFDSTSTTYASELMTAVFAAEQGKVGNEVVEAIDSANTTTYYVIKVTKKSEKAKDWKTYKDILRKYIISQRSNNPEFQRGVVSEELTAANVKVKDSAFQAAFSEYMNSGSASSSVPNSSGEKTPSEGSSKK